MSVIVSAVLLSIGIFLWFWGGFRLVGKHRYVWKIHAMGVSDTIGSFFILAGALVSSLNNWPHILLAIGAVLFWGTAFSLVLGRMGNGSGGGLDHE